MKRVIFSIWLGWLALAPAQTTAPTLTPRLAALKTAYEAALARQEEPVEKGYLEELGKLKQIHVQNGDLPAALAIEAAIRGAPVADPSEKLVALRDTRRRALERIAQPLRATYIRELQKLKVELTRAGDLPGAVQTETEWKTQQALDAGIRPDGFPVYSLVMEAFIDGPSELRVTPDSLYWINGQNGKPGFSGRGDEPVLVNDANWTLKWQKPENRRGVDTSERFALPFRVDPAGLTLKLLSVSAQPKGTGILKRDEIVTAPKDGELSITIPDSQSGQCWYRFVLQPRE
jgi:hypothetical protein